MIAWAPGSIASCPWTQVVDGVSLHGFLHHMRKGKYLCKEGGDDETIFSLSFFTFGARKHDGLSKARR